MSDKNNALRSFINNGSENSHLDRLSKLQFLSKLKPDEYINVNTLSTSQKGWFTTISRTISRSENRTITYEFIRNLLNESFQLCNDFIKNNEQFYQDLAHKLLDALEESKGGIRNLCQTYITDTIYCAKLDALINTLDLKIQNLKTQLQSNTNYNEKY